MLKAHVAAAAVGLFIVMGATSGCTERKPIIDPSMVSRIEAAANRAEASATKAEAAAKSAADAAAKAEAAAAKAEGRFKKHLGK
jgi:hypothetical protein